MSGTSGGGDWRSGSGLGSGYGSSYGYGGGSGGGERTLCLARCQCRTAEPFSCLCWLVDLDCSLVGLELVRKRPLSARASERS